MSEQKFICKDKRGELVEEKRPKKSGWQEIASETARSKKKGFIAPFLSLDFAIFYQRVFLILLPSSSASHFDPKGIHFSILLAIFFPKRRNSPIIFDTFFYFDSKRERLGLP